MMPTENPGKTFLANSAGLSADALQCMEILEKKCRAGEISLSDVQLKQFAAYFDLLTETNKVMNLTALISPEDVAVKHFIDSLLCYDERLIKGKTVIDVGTGAGFPGIPLKIYDPSIKLVLLDSLAKRLSFLEKVTEQLHITGVRFEHMRAEDAGHSKVLRGKFDVAVSRAVARLSVLAEYCLPLVKKGGSMIALKGSKYKEEMDEAGKAVGILGGKIIEAREVVLPGLDDGRAIIVIQKIKDTPSLYPRKAGLPAKKPLGCLSGI